MARFLTMAFIAALTLFIGSQADPAFAAPFEQGHVFAGISNGLIQHYDADGNLLDTIDTGLGDGPNTTGCALDSTGDLYVTTFSEGGVISIQGPDDPHTNLGAFGSGYSGNPESIVFDASGNVYVGAVNGDNDIRKFDAAGNLVDQFDVATERKGSDWIDLAADQRTMFYTSEGNRILRYDVVADQQLPDFTTNLPGSIAYALRILPDDGVLVANNESVVRLNAAGDVVNTYNVPGEDTWFSLNLDPDGTSFWAGNSGTGRFYKFDIEAGGDPLLTVDTGVGSNRLFGVCVFGEKTVAIPEPDHLACYKVEEKDHKNGAKKVILHNQFEEGTKVYVGELKLLCVPTQKELDKDNGDKGDKK